MTAKGLLFSFSLLCCFVYGQSTNAFRVNYDQALFDLPGNATEALTANNYVFAGTNLNFLPIFGTVTQVDDIGALVWSKRYYDGSLGFQLNDIKKDASLNEYYLCGGSESNAAVFMRIDAAGNVIVSTKFEISEADGAYLKRIIKTSDGGYVAVGYVTGHDPDGAGPETYFGPITYLDNNNDSQTDYISSPLIVKFDANGNHLWHHVFRYYTAVTMNPAERIYNDATLNDIVEVGDGYIAVGQYDVNQHRSVTDSDGDDATPNDALIIKTSTAGVINYHRQVDNPSTSTGQSTKYLGAISKTSVGDPIAGGWTDDGYELIMKYQALGGFGLTFSRRFRYSNSFFGTDPVDISQIYEVNGSSDIVTMGMYIKPLSLIFSNSLHRVNSTATANVWAKYYTFSLATILPRGSQTSDGGFIMNSTVFGAGDFDYHLIKTDPLGDTPLVGCAPVSFTPSASAGPTTIGTPFAKNWSGTVLPNGLAVLTQIVNPTATIQCSFTSCTAPVINTQPTNQTICSTGSGNLTVAATAGPYQWQYDNGGSWENVVNGSPSGFTYTNSTTDNLSITTTGAAQGTYQYQVIVGAPGCETISNTVTVTVPGATQLAPAGPTCSGIALNFDAFPASGATYTWNVTVPPGTSATPLTGAGQTFSYTPTNNTVTSQNFTVDADITVNGVTCSIQFINAVNPQPTAPIVGAITQPDCSTPTGSVALSGLPAAGTWTVTASPGGATETNTGTTGTISGLAANTAYTFTVTNSFGCTSVASTGATIDPQPAVPSAPIIGVITQPDCTTSTGSVALSGLPATGTWTVTASPGGGTLIGTGTTGTFTGLAPNTYTFTVTDALGCTSAASANAIIDPVPGAPTAPIVGTITQPDCTTPTGSVDLSGLPGSGTWTLTETPGGATINGTGTTTTITGLTASTTYTYTVTNDLGCTSSSSVNIVITTQLTTPSTPIVGTITQPDCATPTGSVDFSGLPAVGTWTITASPGGATETNTGTTGTISGLAANTIYTFTVVNSDGCTSTATIGVTIDPQPTTPSAPIIGTITQPDCTNPTGSVNLSGLPASGTWTVTVAPGGGTINGTGTTATFTGLAQGNSYTFTVTNDVGCTSAASTNVVIDVVAGAPIITLVTQTNVTCNNGTDGEIDISVSGGQTPYNYSWTPNVGATSNITGLTAGSYTILVTDSLGCTSTDTYTITQPNALVINEIITDVNCEVSLGSITTALSGGNGPYSYDWSPNAETTPDISNLSVGNYGLIVTDANGCTVTGNFSVVAIGSLSVDINPNYTLINAGESVQLNATGGIDYTWTPPTGLSCTDCENPFASPTETTMYFVTASDSSGCVGTDSSLVEIEMNCGDLYVPNIFSPNGDMSNDYLCVYGDCVTKLKYSVYDRWGELVFQTEFTVDLEINNYEEVCWDGLFRGKPLSTGVYAYKLYAELYDGVIIEESGNVTLVR